MDCCRDCQADHRQLPRAVTRRDNGDVVIFRRPSPDTLSPSIKSLNYVNNILARMEANERGADEALMLDVNGYVAEATADNVFVVTARGLVTPPTATNLNGVTRETVLEISERLGIRCEERPFSLLEVWTAREVFVCGTGAEVVPVLEVDGPTIGSGAVGATTRQIVDAYATLVRSTGTPVAMHRAEHLKNRSPRRTQRTRRLPTQVDAVPLHGNGQRGQDKRATPRTHAVVRLSGGFVFRGP
jgi:hypothetical protein